MEHISDIELLRRYCDSQDEDAFSELVSRHVDLVYSAAIRQVQSPQLAEEICQTAFTSLIKAAKTLNSDTIVSAWLYGVARRRSIDIIRSESRRRNRERIAIDLQQMQTNDPPWKAIEPYLDEAMASLNEQDRSAVILKYFENKKLTEVGRLIGISEDAAQKRVSRATQQLAKFFNKRGIAIHSATLISLISQQAVSAAPLGLALSVSNLALTSVSVGSIGSTISHTLAMTTFQKTFVTATVTIGIGTGLFGTFRASQLEKEMSALKISNSQTMETLKTNLAEQQGRLKSAHAEISRLKNDLKDIHRLRANVTKYRRKANDLSKRQEKQVISGSIAQELVDRVATLKSKFEDSPEAWIPEMDLLSEEDWMQAARNAIDTAPKLRRTMSELRGYADSKAAAQISHAVKQFTKNTSEIFPSSMSELAPYLEIDLEQNWTDRWEVTLDKNVKSLTFGHDYLITQKGPVDDIFDTQVAIGPGGFGSADFYSSTVFPVLEPVFEAYAKDHNGNFADEIESYFQYAQTNEQREALEKQRIKLSASE